MANAKPLEQVELKDGDVVHFNLMSPEYGRAEFDICPKWKRGKLAELFIYARQQKNVSCYWHVTAGWPTSFGVGSWQHKKIAVPNIWTMHWCKDHKCMSMSVYPPDGTNRFRISLLSWARVHFEGD